MGKFSWEAFNRVPVVGIIRNISGEDIERIAALYTEAGMTTIEITMNTPGALDMIHSLSSSIGDRLNVGAGTVCSMQELDLALNAGAAFIVTPVINEPVIKKCVENGITIFPGAYTPSEIYNAWSLGAELIKVFPAAKLGVEYIKEVLAPLNKIKLMPTGGVSLENCEAFFKAGAKAVGMGGNLFPKDLISSKNWEELAEVFQRYHAVITKIKTIAI
ncbi:MAG TPA: bifunctional 4-hydroxy-2-oxoglutarate aldolase/2-dehydro-3-deoxy-phosphogluconate aldolase [Flavitalea sp.]|nr:bifunctional 4-hydroxy-2-oxoglutarate aldolase/2-dehydro-3-deoxy-phosphogluconate aldolase [Flavitalea sp.]